MAALGKKRAWERPVSRAFAKATYVTRTPSPPAVCFLSFEVCGLNLPMTFSSLPLCAALGQPAPASLSRGPSPHPVRVSRWKSSLQL